MAPLRPANLNKRLVSETGGNGGVIGPTKTPYVGLNLGARCCGGRCSGRFTINEHSCGSKCLNIVDFKGFFICCGPGATKWFVSPYCTQVSRDWFNSNDAVTVSNSCMGSCGWFIPCYQLLVNPGYCCRVHWDSYDATLYWSSSDYNGVSNYDVNLSNGSVALSGYPHNRSFVRCIRTFRCI